jgi:hypothetical protein
MCAARTVFLRWEGVAMKFVSLAGLAAIVLLAFVAHRWGPQLSLFSMIMFLCATLALAAGARTSLGAAGSAPGKAPRLKGVS